MKSTRCQKVGSLKFSMGQSLTLKDTRLDARRAEVLAHATKRIQRQIRAHLTRREFIILRNATINFQTLWRGT
ncbi:hypothetical protein ACS0TY_022126 [Phlomoides rotata]